MIFSELISTTVIDDNSSVKLTPEYIDVLISAAINSASNDVLGELNEYLIDRASGIFQELQNFKFQYLQYKFNNSTKFDIWQNLFYALFWEHIQTFLDLNSDIAKQQIDILKQIIFYYCTLLSSDEAYTEPVKIWEMLYSHVINAPVWNTLPFPEKFTTLRDYLASFFLEARNSKITLEDAIAKALKGVQENTDIYSGIIAMESTLFINRLQIDNLGDILKLHLIDETQYELYKLFNQVKLKGYFINENELNEKIIMLAKKIAKPFLFEKVYSYIVFNLYGKLVAYRTNLLWETSVDFSNVPETRLFHIYLADKLMNDMYDQIEEYINNFLNTIPNNISTNDFIAYLINFNFTPIFDSQKINQYIDEYFDMKISYCYFDPANVLLFDKMINSIMLNISAKLNEIKNIRSIENSDFEYTITYLSTILRSSSFSNLDDLKNQIYFSLANYLTDLNTEDLEILSTSLVNIIKDYLKFEEIKVPVTNPTEWREGIIEFLQENIPAVPFEFGGREYFKILDNINILHDVIFYYKEINKYFIEKVKDNALKEVKITLNEMVTSLLNQSFFNPTNAIIDILLPIENKLTPEEYNSFIRLTNFYINGEIELDDLYTHFPESIIDVVKDDLSNFKNEYVNSFELIKNNVVNGLFTEIETNVISQINENIEEILSPIIDLEPVISNKIDEIYNDLSSLNLPNDKDEIIEILTPYIQQQYDLLKLEEEKTQQVVSSITDIVLKETANLLNDRDLISLCEQSVINSQGNIISALSSTSPIFINAANEYKSNNPKQISIKETSVLNNDLSNLSKINTMTQKKDTVSSNLKNLSKNLKTVKKIKYPSTNVTVKINKNTHPYIASKKNDIDSLVSTLDDANKKLEKKLNSFLKPGKVSAFIGKIGEYGDSLVSLANTPVKFLNTIENFLTRLFNTPPSIISIISRTFKGIVDAFKNTWKIINRIANKLIGLCRGIVSAICSFLGADRVRGIIDSFTGENGSLKNGLVSLGKNLLSAGKEKLNSTISGIKGFFSFSSSSDQKLKPPKDKRLKICEEFQLLKEIEAEGNAWEKF